MVSLLEFQTDKYPRDIVTVALKVHQEKSYFPSGQENGICGLGGDLTFQLG